MFRTGGQRIMWRVGVVALAALLVSCEPAAPAPLPAPSRPTPTPRREPTEVPERVEMGERRIGSWRVRTSRVWGDYLPGSALAVEARIEANEGAPPIRGVRMWLGYEDPRVSRSGLIEAEAEESGDGTLWRASPAMPAPYPDGPNLWVQIEGEDDGVATGWFYLTPLPPAP